MGSVNLVNGFDGFIEFTEWIWWNQVMDLLDLLDLVVNFMNICVWAKSGPNPSSRPLNMQLLPKIPIRIQRKASRTQK